MLGRILVPESHSPGDGSWVEVVRNGGEEDLSLTVRRGVCVSTCPLERWGECDDVMESDDPGENWGGRDKTKAQYRPSQGERNKGIKVVMQITCGEDQGPMSPLPGKSCVGEQSCSSAFNSSSVLESALPMCFLGSPMCCVLFRAVGDGGGTNTGVRFPSLLLKLFLSYFARS